MRHWIEKSAAGVMDAVMCAAMNALQRRRPIVGTREEIETYLTDCASLDRATFYQPPTLTGLTETEGWLTWQSPRPSGFARNDRPRVRYYPTPAGPSAPTVLLLHALMSANDFGYRKVARWFNDRGWNAVFPHLPFHYSRTPEGYLNGELAITADLVRNGEALRQGVTELRQLMALLRSRGCREFGVVGTSYGGWTGALLSFVEADFRFVSIIQPIVNVEHAIWESPGSASLRRLLRQQDIPRGASERHAHLTSPSHGTPLCGTERVLFTSGLYDTVSPPSELRALHRRWTGSTLLEVRQGHFGHTALRETLTLLEPRLAAG
jgi:hypothetical protein